MKNGLLLKLNMLSWLFASLDTERDTGDSSEAGKQPKVKSTAPKPVFVILQQIAPMLQTIVSNWIMDAGVVEVHIITFNSLHTGEFSTFFFVVCSFFKQLIFFKKFKNTVPSECQTVWIQTRRDILSGLVWIQTVCIFGYHQKFLSRILYHQSVKQFGSRPGPTFCQAWSGSKLFAKDISKR